MIEKLLILTVGLPQSGKTTWALSTDLPIVSRNAIRLALHGEAYIQIAEDMITAIELYMVKSLFLAGNDKIVLDNCNFNFEYRKPWVKQPDWDTKLKAFDVSKEICIERAKANNRPDLIPVIQDMAEKYGSIKYLLDGGMLYE